MSSTSDSLAFAWEYSARARKVDHPVFNADGYLRNALTISPEVIGQQPNLELRTHIISLPLA